MSNTLSIISTQIIKKEIKSKDLFFNNSIFIQIFFSLL